MEFFYDIFEYQYLANALLAAVFAGITCGIVGTYVVARRMVFLCGGITHASFGGLGIALYAGVNPIGGAMIFAILSAMGIEWASDKGKIREDSAIGIIWSIGMAIGALFMSLTPGYTSGDLASYMFGSIVTVTTQDIITLGIFTSLCVAGAVGGLIVSYNWEIPPGTCIIFMLTLALIAAKLLSLRSKKQTNAY